MVLCSADDPDSADGRALPGELGQAPARISGDSGAASLDASDVRGPRAAFVVARAANGGTCQTDRSPLHR